MSPTQSSLITREGFEQLASRILKNPKTGEHWTISLEAEDTQFIRFNQARVRQTGVVADISVNLSLVLDLPDGRRSADASVTLSGESQEILSQLETQMAQLRKETPSLPADPYATLPETGPSSAIEKKGELPSREHAVELIREPLGAAESGEPADLAGIFASGRVIRANATSAGTRHWYATDSFTFDYSLYTPEQKALKNLYAGMDWNSPAYRKMMEQDRAHLEILSRAPVTVPRGEYRVFLGPQAVYELLGMFSWQGVSESAIRQQESPFRLMRSGEKEMSPLFHLSEDFTIGLAPRFNDEGQLAPETLPVISGGKLVNTLISPRTAAEYKLKSNGATDSETLRSPVIHAGPDSPDALRNDDVAGILRRLGTGLFLSNLHYLNWSDAFTGRITGMTRYACFWVENGEIKAPIQDLRFDESIFTLFGSELEALTADSLIHPSTSTYGSRDLGGGKVPGILVKKMRFTL